MRAQSGAITSTRLVPLLVEMGATVSLRSPGVATAASGESVFAVCGRSLSSHDVQTIASLGAISTLRGAGLPRLEDAAERHHEIAALPLSRDDRRGLFSVGPVAVEADAVMPLQRDPGSVSNPEWAHSISVQLRRRYLVNRHAEFVSFPVNPLWDKYFE
ncbi:hypothetical protein ABH922_001928 [Rhodococcus sp. 27YEA15]|uniref:hypothetical protein n=1 Tax=Rhodococcus sp. 27YEA15 TaxID=3156259 RepID=UPI003C79DB33